MAKGTLLYFVSDLHGSSLCFRKFVNATQVYKPTVLVLGGDVAGKAIQSIVKGPNGRWNCTFVGQRYDLTEGSELAGLERLIADHGYYPYRAEPGELEAMEADGTLDELFFRLMRDRLAEWLDLKALLDRRTDGFSTGERMKVAIARALVHDPPNVMLDEPTNGLDVMSTRSVRDIIRTLRGQGRCVLFSSHVMQEVSALCDRIVVIARGRVVADGTPAELRARAGTESL